MRGGDYFLTYVHQSIPLDLFLGRGEQLDLPGPGPGWATIIVHLVQFALSAHNIIYAAIMIKYPSFPPPCVL